MRKEFVTPIIETETLSARDRVFNIFESDTSDSDIGGVMGTYRDIRKEEKDHWYGLNRQ